MLILLLLCVGVAHSQEKRTEICVDFRVNSIVIDSAYSNNAVRMQEIVDFLREVRQDSAINITEVSFCGAASPEGSDQLNRKLARGRLSALEQFVRKEVNIPDSIITRNDSYIPWDNLKSQIEYSNFSHKDAVKAILEEESSQQTNAQVDNRIVKLKQLDNGRVWAYMNQHFFSKMRNACVVLVTYKTQVQMPTEQEPANIPDAPEEKEVVEEAVVIPSNIAADTEDWSRKLYLKTNLLYLGAGIANAAVEIDLAKHLSFSFPAYYSAWDYIKPTIKLRTLAAQPELRFWASKNNDGFFAGAHFGLAYYNVALPISPLNGDYRYQDHSSKTPAIGGGVSVGYRLPISKNNHWKMEFSLGAGVYSLHYDVFHNTPNTKDGLMIGSYQKVYWGVDQAAISLSYMFDFKKKGGKR